jgi:colanic acid/amylovoran/stewartan biosynthesis glycosyltransferase WcaL/AmsK/CpsK
MRIAMIVDTFPALSETFVLDQITGLLDRGHSVDIFAFNRGDLKTVHEDVRRYRLLERVSFPPCPSGWARRAISGSILIATNGLRQPRAVMRALNPARWGRGALGLAVLHSAAPFFGRPEYDVVHCHFGPNGRRALRFRDLGLLRGKLVTTFHGFDASLEIKQFGQDVYRDLFQESDLIMVVSHHMRSTLLSLGCQPEKVIVHRVGVDCEKLAFREPAPSKGPLRITSVARLVEKKGIEFGIRAVGRLVEAGIAVAYRIVGEGPLRQPLAQLVSTLELDKQVTFLGGLPRERVLGVLNDTDILLAPSTISAQGDEEGVPTAIMEALATGIPVVSTFHSGIPELVEDGVSGLLAPERDVPGLAERLLYLAAHPNRWAPMGRAGRSHVEKNFNITRLNDQLVNTYARLAHTGQ